MGMEGAKGSERDEEKKDLENGRKKTVRRKMGEKEGDRRKGIDMMWMQKLVGSSPHHDQQREQRQGRGCGG